MDLRKYGSEITGYNPGHERMRILPLLVIAAAMAAKKGKEAYDKNKAEKRAASNATAQGEVDRQVAQQALNRRRLVLQNLAKALGREGFFDSGGGGAFTAAGAGDDWTLPGVPKIKTGGTFGAVLGGAASGAMDGAGAYYGAPTSSPVRQPAGAFMGGSTSPSSSYNALGAGRRDLLDRDYFRV